MEYSHRINTKKARNEGHRNTSLIRVIVALCTFVNIASCKSTAINGHIVTSESEHAYNEPQGDYDDQEFNWKLSTDNVQLYDTIRAKDLKTFIKFLEKSSNITQRPSIRRYKRSSRTAVYGRDNRKQVSSSIEAQVLPYLAAVKISQDCSGTLVGPKYVLTAAHCVFKGSKRIGKRKLKIGLLQRNGKVRWRPVRKVYAPREWRTSDGEIERMKHDYAILELRRKHGRLYMKPAVYEKDLGRSTLQINGFPGDKKTNTMWHARCPAFQKWSFNGCLVVNCVVTKGMSGSGAYQLASTGSYTTMGVLVAAGYFTAPNKKRYKFNLVNPLTPHKRKRICKWMKAGKDCKRLNR